MNILIQANQEASLFILQIEVGIIFIAYYYALLLSRLKPGAPALAALHPAALKLHMSGDLKCSVLCASCFTVFHFLHIFILGAQMLRAGDLWKRTSSQLPPNN